MICVCFHRYGYHITKASYFICHDQGTIKQLFENLRNYDGKNNYPKTCGRFAISGIRDLTTGYDDSQPDKKAVSNIFYQLNTSLFTFYYTWHSLTYLIMELIEADFRHPGIIINKLSKYIERVGQPTLVSLNE